jgi:hypothetical protein
MSQFMNKNIIFVAVFAGVAIAAWWFSASKPEKYVKEDIVPAGYTQAGQLKYSIKIHNALARTLPRSEFRLFLPVKSSTQQWVGAISSNIESKILSDDLGNQIAYFRFADLKPGDSRDLNVNIDTLRSVDPVKPLLENKAPYLVGNEQINITHEVVAKLAAELKGDTAEKTVTNILGWIAENIKPEEAASEETNKSASDAADKGEQPPVEPVHPPEAEANIEASEVISSKKYSELGILNVFTALARANDLPVRFVVGLDKKEGESGAALSFNDAVGFVQFFDSKQWQSVSITEYKIFTVAKDFQSMRYLTELSGAEFFEPVRMLYEAVGINAVRGSEHLNFK